MELSSKRSKPSMEPEIELFWVAKSPTAGKSSQEKVLIEGAALTTSYVVGIGWSCILLVAAWPERWGFVGGAYEPSIPSAMLPRPGGFLHNNRTKREYRSPTSLAQALAFWSRSTASVIIRLTLPRESPAITPVDLALYKKQAL